MIYDHFGLHTRPFRTTPDRDAYYPSSTHERTLGAIHRELDDQAGIICLTGLNGIGKTLLLHVLQDQLSDNYRCIFLTNCRFRNRAELLQSLLFDLDLAYTNMREHELRLSFMKSCLDHYQGGGSTLIVADEAHQLSSDLLEELCILNNLAGSYGKVIQIVLSGLPSLADKFLLPELSQYMHYGYAKLQLQPLETDEAADYLLHQIRRCGGIPEKVLGEDVLDILSHAGKGIPRTMNQAAHTAFRFAFEAESAIVDAEAAVEAINLLGLDDGEAEAIHTIIPGLPRVIVEPKSSAHEEKSIHPAPLLSFQMNRDNEPLTYVYGGLKAEDEHTQIEELQKAINTARTRTG